MSNLKTVSNGKWEPFLLRTFWEHSGSQNIFGLFKKCPFKVLLVLQNVLSMFYEHSLNIKLHTLEIMVIKLKPKNKTYREHSLLFIYIIIDNQKGTIC